MIDKHLKQNLLILNFDRPIRSDHQHFNVLIKNIYG
jgi:hypothetical protein